jgi:N-acetylneuraminic acid mutarotase
MVLEIDLMNKPSLLIIVISLILFSSCAPKIQPAQSDAWTQLASMPTPRSENTAAVVGQTIYISGGFGGERTLEAYDTVTDTWSTLTEMPEPRHHLMSASHGGKVYVFGGGSSIVNWIPRDEAWVYDPNSDSWAEIASMPEPRLAGAAVTLGDHIYVLGGTGGTNALLRYDPALNEWITQAEMSESREHTSAAVSMGRSTPWADAGPGAGELRSVEVYDPASDTWSGAADLQTARGGFAAVVVDGMIHAIGGEVLTGENHALTSVEVFSPEGGGWVAGPDLPLPLHGVPAVNVDGVIYVLGGADRAGAISNQGLVFALKP